MARIHSSLFRRYLISYILVFLIPLLASGVLFQLTALRDLSLEADASSLARLRQLRDVLDQRLTELDAMAARITADPRLTAFQLRQTGFPRLEAVRELARYAASSVLLHDVILFPSDQDDVYLSTGSMSWNRFVDAVAVFERLPPDAVRRLVLEASGPTILPAQEYRLGPAAAERVLVLVYPIPPRSPHPHATILYLIREAEVVRLLANAVSDPAGAVVLADPAGQLLASFPRAGEPRFPSEWGLIAAAIPDSHSDAVTTVATADGDLSVASVRSPLTDARLVSITSREAHQVRVVGMRNTLMIFALSLAVVGGAISFWLSWSSYTPIRALRDFVAAPQPDRASHPAEPSAASRYSEIEAILAGLRSAYDARDRLASAIETQRPLARAQLLTRLLQGIDDDVFQSLSASAGFSFRYSHYFVFLIGGFVRNRMSAWEREAVIQSLSEFDGEGYTACGVEIHHREAVAVIVNVQQSRSIRAVQRRVVSAALGRMDEHRPSRPGVAVGLVHPGVRGITSSYLEAMAASEYTAADGVRLQFFADITGPAASLPRLPLQQRLRLLQAVKEGQLDLATAALGDIVATLSEVVPDSAARRRYHADLAGSLLELPRQLGLDVETLTPSGNGGDDPITGLTALVQSLCRQVIVDRCSSADRLARHAVEFVEQNSGDPGLSLALVADRFGTSLSHLSRVFKDHTGKTFSDYLGDLRIERMMVLLRSTDQSVKEIVSRVGYQDVPNCIRKFRQVVGQTPGRYRRG